MAAIPEFFVLVVPDYSQAFSDTDITDNMTMDTPEGPFTVTNATNAAPIVVTVSATHNLAIGRGIFIQDVTGNSGANGYFYITAVTANTMTLSGSAGTGAYISGGTVIVTNVIEGHGQVLGEVIQEEDVLEINLCVVPPPPVAARVSNHAY